MNSLENLKRVLDVSPDEDLRVRNCESVESLDELKKYIERHLTEKPGEALLLEEIKTKVSNEFSVDEIFLTDLSEKDLDYLKERFSQYEKHVIEHKEKIIPVQEILDDFNKEISHLSSSLSSLQERSIKLSNNSGLQAGSSEKLNSMILDLMIQPEILKSVLKKPINPEWLENLKFINEKLALIKSVESGKIDSELGNLYMGSKSFEQLKLRIELLLSKALERIRNYIVYQIKRLRSNVSLSSQTVQLELLKVKDILPFLRLHNSELAKDLELAYAYTMRWYYRSRFAKYLYSLEKLHLREVDQSVVIGNEHEIDDKAYLMSNLKGWFSGLNLGSSSQPGHLLIPQKQQSNTIVNTTEYLMSIDKRLLILDTKLLQTQSQSAMPSQIAETTPFAYWLEFVFNQWRLALIDNIIVEYFFMIDFFYDGEEKFDNLLLPQKEDDDPRDENKVNKERESSLWPNIMFQPLFNLSYQFVEWLISHQTSQILGSRSAYNPLSSSASNRLSAGSMQNIQGTCDGFAILLMIRLTQKSYSQLHDEYHIPVLDDHLNSLQLLLWAQFTKVIDLNCESMKRYITHSSILGLKINHLAPIGLTQNFAQYVLALLKLTSKNEGGVISSRGEPLNTSVNRLRNDYESVLTRLCNQWFGNSKSKTAEREIFLYNNYFVVLSTLKNETVTEDNELANDQMKHFEMLCDAYRKK